MSQTIALPKHSFSPSLFALTLEGAFQYSEKDSKFVKLEKFAVGTILTTTACIAAIVETVISSLITILTFPLYPIAPKRYAQITQHTADSARTIIAAVKRTFGAEIKPAKPLVAAAVKHPTPAPAPPAPPAPHTMQPEKVEKLLAPSQNFASRALQFSKEHKTLMVALALGTATLATAFFLYYLKMTPPSNSLILPPPHSATLPSAVSSSAISSATSISAVSSSAISSATSTSAVSSSAISSATSTSAVSLTHPTRTSIANTFSTTIATLTKQLTTNSTISRPIASIPTQATNHILSSSTKLILCLSVGMIIYVLMRSRRNRKDQDIETSSARTIEPEKKKKKKKRTDEAKTEHVTKFAPVAKEEAKKNFRNIINRSRAKGAGLRKRSDHRPFNVRHGKEDPEPTPNPSQLGDDPSGGRGNSFQALEDLVDDLDQNALDKFAPEGSGEETGSSSGGSSSEGVVTSSGESGSGVSFDEFLDLSKLATGVDLDIVLADPSEPPSPDDPDSS